jgi:uncharacterized NAD-dependent epimerase/dehydratase family protein
MTAGRFHEPYSKVAHGLVRETDRYQIIAVVDTVSAGRDAGEIVDGSNRGLPVVASITEAIALTETRPTWAILGVATHGGRLSDELIACARDALQNDLSVVCGLHGLLCDQPQLVALAAEKGLELIDLRKPRRPEELHFWTGRVHEVSAPRLAVLGTDCAVGKRTTTRWLMSALHDAGVHAEMIFTGQTGWLQGSKHGFVLDSTPNDFVSGELEHAIVACDDQTRPDLILLEGQSALRNPSGPCGSELLLSGAAKAAILQHAPGRIWFDDFRAVDARLPSVRDEIDLICAYGSRVLGVTLNGEGLSRVELLAERDRLRESVDVVVVAPLVEGVEALVEPIKKYLKNEAEK